MMYLVHICMKKMSYGASFLNIKGYLGVSVCLEACHTHMALK